MPIGGRTDFSFHRSGNDLCDNLSFGVGVNLAGFPLLLGQRQFCAGIQLAIAVVDAQVVAEREHTVSFPPILGWLLVGGGICAIAFGAFSKKS